MAKTKKTTTQTTSHARLSASSAHRWMNCPGSVKLVDQTTQGAKSIYAAEGTVAHEVAEEALTKGTPLDVFVGQKRTADGHEIEVTAEMIEAVSVYLEVVELTSDAADEVFVELQIDLKSYFPRAPQPMFGTLDFGAYFKAGRVLKVVDYKHGKGVPVEVGDNPQLLYYAAGAVAALKDQGHAVELIEITVVQPRAPHPDGGVRTAIYASVDVNMWVENELRPAVERVHAKAPTLVSGAHCKFCPARGSCPALKQLAVDTARVEFAPVSINSLSNDELADVLNKAELITTFVNAARAEASARIDRGAKINGWKLIPKRAVRSWIDEDRAAQVLSSLFGLTEDETHVNKLKSVAQIVKLVDDPSQLDALIDKTSSGTTLAPDTDPRPEQVRHRAADEFASV